MKGRISSGKPSGRELGKLGHLGESLAERLVVRRDQNLRLEAQLKLRA
jgi:hypothetical protein